MKINGITEATSESDGTIKRNGLILAKIEKNGNVMKNGLIVGTIDIHGKVKLHHRQRAEKWKCHEKQFCQQHSSAAEEDVNFVIHDLTICNL